MGEIEGDPTASATDVEYSALDGDTVAHLVEVVEDPFSVLSDETIAKLLDVMPDIVRATEEAQAPTQDPIP